MNSSILLAVVIGQIAVFQFVAVAFARSVFAAVLGDPRGPIAKESTAYLRKAARSRWMLGGTLLLITVVSAIALPLDSGTRKLLLAAVSLVSAGAFVLGSISDRRVVRALREALPDSGVRRASLRPRSVGHWYRMAWEVVPVAILVVTLIITITLVHRLGRVPTELIVWQALQAAVVFAGLFYTFHEGTAVPNVASRLAMLRHRPALALDFGERLAAREMRYFMAAKVGMALLLGVNVAETGLKAFDHAAASVVGMVNWVIVAALLALFAIFVWQIGALTKHMQSRVEHESHDPNGTV